MKTLIATVATTLLVASASAAEDPAQALARGKLEMDLGHYSVAAQAFAAASDAPEATPVQRWEALARLGVARREAGDATGGVAVFEKAFRDYGRDPEALRFLILAVGGALPGKDRWDAVWQQVTLEADRRDPDHPSLRVRWPGVPSGLCPCSGTAISLDIKDGDLQDVFRLFADVSRMNVVVQPGTQGHVTYSVSGRPWDEVLEQLLSPNGYAARIQGNVIRVGRPGDLGPHRSFSGTPISVDFTNRDLIEALREVAASGHATVEVPPGVAGRIWLKLDDVPWDQALDLVAWANGLTWNRTGDVIRVSIRQPTR
ncbi:MAG TPA: secretin and TonB N-terminal domain-containing protein [Vicinamibacteria bacterium]|nr:secretin and TonB N-terminal domain-containing protein [Vicinamibacteria bacterium]